MVIEDINPPAEPVSPTPAPLGRRIGAHLLDSAAALIVIHLALVPVSLAYQLGFGLGYLIACQIFVVAWVLLRDSWWPGQSLGKRLGRILITASQTGQPASRLRCIWRQVIFTFVAAACYLPAYLYLFRSPEMITQALFSSLLTVTAPIRLLGFLLPSQEASAGPVMTAHMVILGFILLEGLMVYSRANRRRIIDRLAGVTIVDAKSPRAD